MSSEHLVRVTSAGSSYYETENNQYPGNALDKESFSLGVTLAR